MLPALALSYTEPDAVLKTVFGYDSFRGQQKEVIDYVMNGGSCCTLMPTGAGKSLCYQIPALCRPGVGVVVSPLIALMQDQVSALHELGIRAAAIHSGLESGAMSQTLRDLRAGNLDLIYIAPERIMTDMMLDLLDDIEIALFAIDEAHCVSQWGHDFRPEYRALSMLRSRYPHVPCIATTASADVPTRKDIIDQLNLAKLFVSGFDRPNIRYEVVVKNNPKKQLLEFLATRKGESGIVYCLSRRKTEEIAEALQQNGYPALPYHAGLESSIRAENQNRFLKEEAIIMVATIAFGMGINKPDVRFVAHVDLPQNIEAYYQETGRAGRDGLPAIAWMSYGLQDVAMRRQMINGSNAPEEQKRLENGKLGSLLGYCEAAQCRRQILLQYFGDASQPCGNCDTCLAPPATMDGTLAAQKLLSCVYRTGQMFGTKHVIDVLLGVPTAQTDKHGHAALSTWGIGAEHDRKAWESFMRQLVAANLLHVDMEEYSSVKITPDGSRFLKEKAAINLRLPDKGRMVARSSANENPVNVLETAEDRALFDRLKATRLQIARDHNLPPYVIFHDKTLLAMAMQRPVYLDAMAEIPGVGRSKLEKYGEIFLKVIQDGGRTAT